MRLDWFLPFLRKQRKDQPPPSLPIVVRGSKQVLPASWFADHQRGRPGKIRRGLKWLGPTWLSSPLRRFAQAVCFLLFLVLFFFVAWPYTAKPQDNGQQFPGWRLAQVGDDGAFRWTQPDVSSVRANQLPDTVHVIDSSAARPQEGYIGEFVVQRAGEGTLQTRPLGQVTPEALDRLLVSSGPWLFSQRDPTRWPSHHADNLAAKEFIEAEWFLVIDPLVSLSTAIAARSWVWSLVCAAIILGVCVLIPRGFCGYLCPLGTLIDLFDWSVTSRTKRFRLSGNGWWVHIKYYLLAGTLLCAVGGVLVSGFVSAIPVITRGMLFIGEPVQIGVLRGWHSIPPLHAGHWLSIGLFAAVLMLGFLQPRFWCKYVCPSGAVFSIGNLFRVTERKVESSCINCNRCIEICPFDAIKPDFTTRTSDCTLCQSCGGVCPVHAIKFVERGNRIELKVENDPPTGETALGRRGFLSLAAGGAATAVGGTGILAATDALGADLDDPHAFRPVRPPGSVPEEEFLQMCIRCGECFKACPNHVLQPEAFQQGLEGLWTPLVNADWAGCDSSCNACGQVCPTGAIRALPLTEKKVARMGLAVLNESTCLPLAGREACQLCVDECAAAGYHAIEFTRVHTEADDQGQPVDGTGYLAPVVLDDQCVGCGLCQTRCHAINVKEKHLLDRSAIVVEAGEGKEDRMMTGSYIERRRKEAQQRQQDRSTATSEFFVPSQEQTPPAKPTEKPATSDASSGLGAIDEDPFGLGTSQ